VRFSIIIILILFLYFDTFNLGIMELSRPKVIVFGHSFVKRLHRDLRSNFDVRAALSFNIQRASVKFPWNWGTHSRQVDRVRFR
jgi:hypothetical protein